MKQIGFFSEEKALERLSKLGDPLEQLDKIIDWTIFLPIMDEIRPDKTQEGEGGRPPYPNIMVIKSMVLKEMNGASNKTMEFFANDRLTWKRFFGLSLEEKAPDENTFQMWEDMIAKSGRAKELFEIFNDKLAKKGIIARKGALVDSTFVDVPRQRISREERDALKRKELPDRWLMPENANELPQRDAEAAWMKKGEEVHFGYKDHVSVDSESKIIIDYEVTPANVSDNREIINITDENDPMVSADSAYSSKEIEENLIERNPDVEILICEKGTRGHPLTDEQKERNREISRIRARVEHVFGRMHGSMGGIVARCIGLTRVRCSVCFKNLAYNILQYGTLFKYGHAPALA